jgi:hypothetical protein
MGMLLSSLAICVQASARDEDMAFAAAMNPWLRAIGQALGLAVFGSVFSNTVRNELLDSPFASQAVTLSNNAISIVQVVAGLTDGPHKEALTRAIWLGTRAVWITCVPFFVVSAIASLVAVDLDLNRHLNSEHKVTDLDNNKDSEKGILEG